MAWTNFKNGDKIRHKMMPEYTGEVIASEENGGPIIRSRKVSVRIRWENGAEAYVPIDAVEPVK